MRRRRRSHSIVVRLALVTPVVCFSRGVLPTAAPHHRSRVSPCGFTFRYPPTKLSSSALKCSNKEEGLFPPSSSSSLPVIVIDEDTIADAAALVSYQCTEKRLGNALTCLKTGHNNIPPPKISLDVRGQLEDYDDDVEEKDCDNIVDLFLSTLASTIRGRKDLSTGLSMCEFLVQQQDDEYVNNAPLQFMPPTRSLIGTIDGMDVALLRDKEDVDTRFSMLFSVDRSKGIKIARLLAEIDEEEGVVHIRGLHVQEAHRKKGLATLLLAFFSHFCRVAFGNYPRTLLMNKPVICIALESLGYTAENEKWPVFLAQHPDKDKAHITLMMAADGALDLRPRFSHAVRKAQNIELVSERPEGSKRVHVLTKFDPPHMRAADGTTDDPVESRLKDSTYRLYSARIVAFLATVGNAKGPMFRRSKGLKNAFSSKAVRTVTPLPHFLTVLSI